MTWVRVRGPRERARRARGPEGKERGSGGPKGQRRSRRSEGQRVRGSGPGP